MSNVQSSAAATRAKRPSRKFPLPSRISQWSIPNPFSLLPEWLRRPLVLAYVPLCLAGCQTTGTTVTTTKAQCAPWRALTYSGRRDSAVTVRGIRVHNLVGQKLKCWK